MTCPTPSDLVPAAVRNDNLTPQEVARRLRLNEQTIRRYLRNGRLSGTRMGSRWLIADADLQRFLWEQRADPKEAMKRA
jgi:excisionase family DNA binding protein